MLIFCTHVLYCVGVSKFCVLYQSVVAMFCIDVLYPCFVLCWCAMPMFSCHPVLPANTMTLESYRFVSVLCMSPPSSVASKHADTSVLLFCLCSLCYLHPVLPANTMTLESYRSVSVPCLSPPSCVASKHHDAGVLLLHAHSGGGCGGPGDALSHRRVHLARLQRSGRHH